MVVLPNGITQLRYYPSLVLSFSGSLLPINEIPSEWYYPLMVLPIESGILILQRIVS